MHLYKVEILNKTSGKTVTTEVLAHSPVSALNQVIETAQNLCPETSCGVMVIEVCIKMSRYTEQ